MTSKVSVLDYSGDVKLTYENGVGTVKMFQNDLVRDKGLETAIIISLFTDRRADPEDKLPDSSQRLGGWWADNTLGSKLWLLQRSKTIQEVLVLAEQYAKEALQWMLDDGVASNISVTATRVISTSDQLLLLIKVTEPRNNGNPQSFKYLYNWQSQLSGN